MRHRGDKCQGQGLDLWLEQQRKRGSSTELRAQEEEWAWGERRRLFSTGTELPMGHQWIFGNRREPWAGDSNVISTEGKPFILSIQEHTDRQVSPLMWS